MVQFIVEKRNTIGKKLIMEKSKNELNVKEENEQSVVETVLSIDSINKKIYSLMNNYKDICNMRLVCKAWNKACDNRSWNSDTIVDMETLIDSLRRKNHPEKFLFLERVFRVGWIYIFDIGEHVFRVIPDCNNITHWMMQYIADLDVLEKIQEIYKLEKKEMEAQFLPLLQCLFNLYEKKPGDRYITYKWLISTYGITEQDVQKYIANYTNIFALACEYSLDCAKDMRDRFFVNSTFPVFYHKGNIIAHACNNGKEATEWVISLLSSLTNPRVLNILREKNIIENFFDMVYQDDQEKILCNVLRKGDVEFLKWIDSLFHFRQFVFDRTLIPTLHLLFMKGNIEIIIWLRGRWEGMGEKINAIKLNLHVIAFTYNKYDMLYWLRDYYPIIFSDVYEQGPVIIKQCRKMAPTKSLDIWFELYPFMELFLSKKRKINSKK